MLQRVSPSFEYETKSVTKKDSVDMTDEDRRLLLKACSDSTIERIVITHGTDTLIETARVLSKLADKTIVLTGASTPELFKDTDADFNFGSAVGAVYALGKGTFIAMNGQVLPWDQVEYDAGTCKFTRKKTA